MSATPLRKMVLHRALQADEDWTFGLIAAIAAEEPVAPDPPERLPHGGLIFPSSKRRNTSLDVSLQPR